MSNPSYVGYLNDSYLSGPYFGDTGFQASAFQVNRIILSQVATGVQVKRAISNTQLPLGLQVLRKVLAKNATGVQVKRVVTNVSRATGVQVKIVIASSKACALQVRRIVGTKNATALQTRRTITTSRNTNGLQVRILIANKSPTAIQVRRIVTAKLSAAVQTKRSVTGVRYVSGFQVRQFNTTGRKPLALQVRRIISSSKATGLQVRRTIAGAKYTAALQVKRIVTARSTTGVQVRRTLSSVNFSGMQVRRIVRANTPVALQVRRLITNNNQVVGLQVRRIIAAAKTSSGMQVKIVIMSRKIIAMQVRRMLGITGRCGMQIRRDKGIAHWQAGNSYLTDAYMANPYLLNGFNAQMGVQVRRVISSSKPVAVQVKRLISRRKPLSLQVKRIIKQQQAVGMQVMRLFTKPYGMQVLLVLYNTTKLRVLKDFPSRGMSGANWTTTSQQAGDFSVNNLNTDIVEQVWRSAQGVTSVSLINDVEVAQGTSVDTLAVLNHNLTTSATFTMQESNKADFSSGVVSTPINVTATNIYYIAPSYPLQQYRYRRFLVNDPTNPAGYLQIGTLVFGNSIVMQGESFVDEVQKRRVHFSDKINTEGYTNVSNDRALKSAVTIEFRSLGYLQGNYKNLNSVFEYARTSLKCLWIPDPTTPARFALFAKLTQIPQETHKNMGVGADYVSFSIDLDESL